MKFTLGTGYAIGILVYMEKNNPCLVRAQELAEHLDVTPLYLMKIVSKLRSAKLIVSEQGCNGGYRLAKKAEDILIYDIVCAIEGEFSIYSFDRCRRQGETTSRILWSTMEYFDTVREKWEIELKKMNLAEYCERYVNDENMMYEQKKENK